MLPAGQVEVEGVRIRCLLLVLTVLLLRSVGDLEVDPRLLKPLAGEAEVVEEERFPKSMSTIR